MTTALKLSNINKRYGDVSALLDINLEVNDGEFFHYWAHLDLEKLRA